MKRITTQVTIALLGLILLSGAVTAQSQSSPFEISYFLPGDGDVRNTAVKLAEGDLAGAMRAALNSEGDTMSLLVELELSVGLFANVGFMGATEVKLEKVSDGYELTFADDNNIAFGVEGMEDLEVNFPVGAEVAVVMHFTQIEHIGRGLRAAALAVIGLPALLMEQTRLDGVLRAALDRIPTLEQSVGFLTNARRQAHAGIVSLQARVAVARRVFFDALYAAEAMAYRAARTPFIGPILRVIANGLFFVARGLEAILDGIDAGLTRALAAIDTTMRALESDAARLAHERDLVVIARGDLNRVLDWISGCGGEVVWLGQRFKAFEGKFHIGAEVEASVAIENVIPGLTLANSGLGISLGGEYSAAVRYQLPREGNPGELSVTLAHACNLGLQGVILAGAEGEAESTLQIDLLFAHQGASWSVASSKTSLEVELGAWAVVGSGISAEYGAGVSLGLSFDNLQIGQSTWSAISALLQSNPQGAIQALGTVEATFKVQTWRHMAAVLGGGFSVAGDGLTLVGSATWRDADVERVAVVSAAQALNAIIGQTNAILTDITGRVSAGS